MPNNYGTIITTAGASLIANCILSGGKVNIKEAAAGDGGGSYYQPTAGQTALRNEKWRGDIVNAKISTSTANMIDVKIVIDDSVGGFTVREIGLFDDDGTLVAICNTPDTEKVALSEGVSGQLTMVVHIVVADASVVTFTIKPALDTVSHEEMDDALSAHNTSSTAHSDIRAMAFNSMRAGEAYTKAESDTLRAAAVDAHNTDDASHADIRVDVTGLESRLKNLELRYGHNVSGNTFEATFIALDGLIVTGIWNKKMARVEF